MISFKNKLKVKCFFYILLIALGIATIILGVIKNSQYKDLDYPYFEYLVSTGVSLIIIGLLKLKKNLTALLNKRKSNELKIEATDERNLMLAYKSGYFAFIISLFSLYVLNLYFLFVESPLFKFSSYLCCFLLIVYIVSYYITKKIN